MTDVSLDRNEKLGESVKQPHGKGSSSCCAPSCCGGESAKQQEAKS